MNTKSFLRKMTVADKARLLCGTGPFTIGGFESSAGPVPELAMQDGGTGINHQHLFRRLVKASPKEIGEEGMNVASGKDGRKITREEALAA